MHRLEIAIRNLVGDDKLITTMLSRPGGLPMTLRYAAETAFLENKEEDQDTELVRKHLKTLNKTGLLPKEDQ